MDEQTALSNINHKLNSWKREYRNVNLFIGFMFGFTFGACITWLAIEVWSPLCV